MSEDRVEIVEKLKNRLDEIDQAHGGGNDWEVGVHDGIEMIRRWIEENVEADRK